MRHLQTVVIGMGAVAAVVLTGCSSTHTPAAQNTPAPSTSVGSSTGTTPETTTPAPTTSSESTPSPTSTTPSPTTSKNTGVAACRTSGLSLTQGSIEGAAGSSYVTYYLRNNGSTTCSMVGFPGFSLLSADGSIIQRPAIRNGQPYKQVLLAPGAKAQFFVQTAHADIPGTGCSTGWKTATVQVYPPNQTVAIRQPSTVPACDLRVSPVSAM